MKIKTIRKSQKGFTLIELMITVAIVGILAAVAMPAYINYTIRGEVAEGIQLVGGAQTVVEEQYAQTGDMASIMQDGGQGLTDAGYKFPQAGKYSQVWTTQGGAIVVIYNMPSTNKALSSISAELDFEPVVNPDGSIWWKCYPGTNMQQRYVPSSCKDTP